MDKLMNMNDRAISLRVSQMLISKGTDLLDSMCQRQPHTANAWAARMMGEILAHKSAKLAAHLRLQQNCGVEKVLQEFSLAQIMSDAEDLAPTLCQLLRDVGCTGALPSGE
jgi:hypothetical protein